MVQHEALPESFTKLRDAFNERADCTVVAIAVAADLPYAEAHSILAHAGRKRRRGFKLRLWLDNQCAMARMKNTTVKLGRFRMTRVWMPHGSATLAKFLRDFPKGRFIARKRSHAFTIVDGKVFNSFTGARTRITNLWYFTEA